MQAFNRSAFRDCEMVVVTIASTSQGASFHKEEPLQTRPPNLYTMPASRTQSESSRRSRKLILIGRFRPFWDRLMTGSQKVANGLDYRRRLIQDRLSIQFDLRLSIVYRLFIGSVVAENVSNGIDACPDDDKRRRAYEGQSFCSFEAFALTQRIYGSEFRNEKVNLL
jgi:hypothetical protein